MIDKLEIKNITDCDIDGAVVPNEQYTTLRNNVFCKTPIAKVKIEVCMT